MQPNQRKCAHNACKCLISGDDIFCSPYCEKRADDGEQTCHCDHEDCNMSIADPVVGFTPVAALGSA